MASPVAHCLDFYATVRRKHAHQPIYDPSKSMMMCALHRLRPLIKRQLQALAHVPTVHPRCGALRADSGSWLFQGHQVGGRTSAHALPLAALYPPAHAALAAASALL
jgi:hypothetical protein